MKLILTRKGEINELAAMFNVSRVSIRSALCFRTHSPLSKRIRAAAIARGGKETEYNN